jgi:competence protein ComEA
MRRKVLWWCMWGIGSIFWIVLTIQIVFAKSETVIIKSESDKTTNESIKVPPTAESISVKTVSPVDSLREKDDQGTEPVSEKQTNKTDQINKKDDCINVNTAKVDELLSLTGIGPVLAQHIVEFRKENGNFKDASDLIKVKGIGEGKLKKIRDSICF